MSGTEGVGKARRKAAGEFSATKLSTHRPDSARASGLRAQVMSSPLYRRPPPQWRSLMRFPHWLRPLASRLSRVPTPRTKQRRTFRPRVEELEDRSLLTGHITELPVYTTPNSGPNVIAYGSDGNLWFTEGNVTTTDSNGQSHGQIARMTPDGHIDEFPTPLAHADYVLAGPDGNIWFADTSGGDRPASSEIGVMSTAGVVLKQFAIRPGSDSDLTVGPDGNIWFTEYWNPYVGRVSTDPQVPDDQRVQDFSIPFSFGANDIITGPDGNLWYTDAVRDNYRGRIGRITPQGVSLQPYSFSNVDLFRGLACTGPGGAVYTGDPEHSTEYSITASGEFTTLDISSSPSSVAIGPDGAIWFTDAGRSQIDRLGADDSSQVFNIPTPYSVPADITAGPGNTLWFTEENANQIGKLVIGPPPTPAVVVKNAAGTVTTTFNEGDRVFFDASGTNFFDSDYGTVNNAVYLGESYQWDLNGDGVFETTGPQASIAFTQDGVHPVTLKVTDPLGLSSTLTVNVTVNEVQPTVALEAGYELDANGNWTAPEGSPISLMGSLYDPDPEDHQPSVSFSWTVTKNGALYASANHNPSASVGDTTTADWFSFTPDDNGTYVVTLSGSDTDGSATDSQTIDVTNVPPTPYLTFPGTMLDPAFGTGGRVTRDFSADDSPSSAVLQSDGKIVVAGSYVQPDGTVDTYVARFLASGQLDPEFGSNGPVVLDGNGYNSKVLVQSTGKILVFTGGQLFRLNPDGTLDTGFGPDQTGVITPPVSAGSIALEGDQILLAGTSDNELGIVLARLTPDGILDTSFGADGTGIVTAAPVSHPPHAFINSVFCDGVTVSGSNILVGALIDESKEGYIPGGSDFGGPFAVARFDSNGILDTSFVGPDGVDPTFQQHGWAITPGGLQDPSESINAMAVQPDGKIVLLGSEGSLVRFAADGALDSDVPSFNNSGSISSYALACQPDGKLLIGGYESLDPPQTPAGALVVTRLNPDLTPDLTFGNNGDGQAMLQFDQGVDSWLSNVLLQPDGNIVVVGASYTQLPDSSWNGNLELARFLAPPSSFHEGETISLQGSGYDPSPVDSQSLTYSWTVTRNGVAYQTASGADYSLLLSDDGSYVVTLTVTDKDGGSSSVSSSFSVSNVPPTASITGPGNGVTDQSLTFTLGSSDPSPDDQAAGFTYQVNWGDGTPIQSVTGPDGLQVDHTYSAAGIYTPTVTATDKDGGTSVPASCAPVQINALTSDNLQSVLSPGGTVTLVATTNDDAQNVLTVVNALSADQTPAATLNLQLSGKIGSVTVNAPASLTLYINGVLTPAGTTLDPDVPALVVNSGNVIVSDVTFTESGNAPAVLVNGGHLTLRNDVIQESTGYEQAAIQITGGSLDLGTSASPGGNTLNINGSGSFVQNATSTAVSAFGDSFSV